METKRTLAQRSLVAPSVNKLALQTIVLDSQLIYIEKVSWQDAVTDILQGKVNVISNYRVDSEDGPEELTIHSGVNTETGLVKTMPLPFIVSQKSFVYYGLADFVRSDSPIATKRAILSRDGYICAYQHRLGEVDEEGKPIGCTYKATTVDHILPQSRRGQNTWENLIASCKWCNNHKADRTPEEAGMKLLWEPKPRVIGEESQDEIWSYLYEEMGL